MPYKFTFDLSKIPRFFFSEITKASYQKGVHKKLGETTQELIRKFKIQEATGLNLSDAVVVLQDLIDIQARNLMERERFIGTTRRALFLPHCCRKFMDSRCQATFDPSVPSYICSHCSDECLVSRAVSLSEKKGYDVYVLPGSSCISRIVKSRGYEGVVGVACGEETRLSGEVLEKLGIAGQAVPLIKNGCANTIFNVETLITTL
jgi:hypothetical protein